MSAHTCDTSRPAPDLNISCHECFRGTGGDGATARSIQGRGEAPAGSGGGGGGRGRGWKRKVSGMIVDCVRY